MDASFLSLSNICLVVVCCYNLFCHLECLVLTKCKIRYCYNHILQKSNITWLLQFLPLPDVGSNGHKMLPKDWQTHWVLKTWAFLTEVHSSKFELNFSVSSISGVRDMHSQFLGCLFRWQCSFVSRKNERPRFRCSDELHRLCKLW